MLTSDNHGTEDKSSHRIMRQFENILADMQKLKGDLKVSIKAYIMAFMEANPDIKLITWEQYTPYFNDGDACQFGVYGLLYTKRAEVAVKALDYYKGDLDNEEEFTEWSDMDDCYDPEKKAPIHCFSNIIEGDIVDLLPEVFGEEARVIVTPKEIIVLEDIDHD